MGGDAIAWCGGAACGAGVVKSKRSPRPELAACGAGDMPGAESKAPNPLDELNPLEGWGGAGVDFWAGFVSKNVPPLLAGGDRLFETWPRLAKAFVVVGDLGEVVVEKPRPLKASFMPPNEDF